MKEKIQKLLNQAADVEGTPEADAFYAKAFELMARHGLSERDLATADREEVIDEVIYFAGTYTDMQAILLQSIARALHCVTMSFSAEGKRQVFNARVFGVRRHVERVVLLFGLLQIQMLRLAGHIRHRSVVTARRSFMMGFANGIFYRLDDAEEDVVDELGAEHALAVVTDVNKAEKALRKYVMENGCSPIRTQATRSIDPRSYLRGEHSATHADLGDRKVTAARLGLPPV